MKNLRILAMVIMIAFSSFVISGCDKVWSFNFTIATNEQLNSWFIDSYLGDVSYDDGAVLDFQGIASPVSFDGDWTMEVVFDLNVDDTHHVHFRIFPADEQGWEPTNYILSAFEHVGWEDAEA